MWRGRPRKTLTVVRRLRSLPSCDKDTSSERISEPSTKQPGVNDSGRPLDTGEQAGARRPALAPNTKLGGLRPTSETRAGEQRVPFSKTPDVCFGSDKLFDPGETPEARTALDGIQPRKKCISTPSGLHLEL